MDSKVFLKMLEENAKAQGLPVLENLAEKLLEAVVKSMNDYAPQATGLVKLALPLAAQTLQSVGKPAIDKISADGD